MAYDSRQRLASRNVGGEVTSYSYDGVRQLILVTLPDLSNITYAYDAAHRLTSVQDNLGNKLAYTLDPEGNRTRGRLRSVKHACPNAAGLRLVESPTSGDRRAQSQTTQYAYDAQGNVTSVTRRTLSHVTTTTYDALNRLASVTQPIPAGCDSFSRGYAYDLDQLTQVTDPRSLVTIYTDGLGNLRPTGQRIQELRSTPTTLPATFSPPGPMPKADYNLHL